VLLSIPVMYYVVSAWLGQRELDQLCAEIAADDPDWQWADLIAALPPAPDNENAFVQLRKVNGLLKTTPFAVAPAWDSPAKEKAREMRNARLSEANVALLRAAFMPLDPKLLPEARRLKEFPKGRLKIDATINPFLVMLDEIQHAREIMRLLDCDIHVRTHDNDLAGAAESWHALLNTSHAIEDNPTLIGQLVRMAGQAIAVGALERMLAQGELTDAELVNIQTLLRRETKDNLLYFGMRGERAINHRTYTDVRDGKLEMSKLMGGMTGRPPGILDRAADLFPSVLLRGYPEHLRLLDAQVKASKLKDEERIDALEKIEQEARKNGNLLTRLLLPATMKVGQASSRTQAQIRCALAALAAERYRATHDAWPTSLDELVKERLLDAIPTDPFDGKALRFKRTPTGIVIYSIGLDKIDNQGNLSRSNPYGPGTDLGFEVWDRLLRGMQAPVEEEP
jgi:hypothetical protein